MKISIYFLYIILISLGCKAQPTNPTKHFSEDSLEQQIVSLSFHQFLGEETSKMFENEYISQYEKTLFSDEPPFVLNGLWFIYSNGLKVKLVIHEFDYLKSFNEKRNWDMNLLKKEKVSAIILYKKYKKIAEYR